MSTLSNDGLARGEMSQELRRDDTYLVARNVDSFGDLFAPSNSDYLDFHVCLDPGDEILEAAICFTEASLLSPPLQSGNNLNDVLDTIAAQGQIGVVAEAPVPVEGESTITTSRTNRYVLVDATSGAVTVNIYNSASYGSQPITVKKTDASGNAVTLVADYGNTIDGAASVALSSQYDFVTLVPQATNWWVVATNF